MIQPRCVSPNARAMARAWTRRVLRVVQAEFPCRLELLATILAEYRRAIAAARRYEELKLHRESIVRQHHIPRRIFEEFYARTDGGCGASEQANESPTSGKAQKSVPMCIKFRFVRGILVEGAHPRIVRTPTLE